MRLIDPTKTIETVEKTEYGSVTTREHHDGSVDATVKIKALRIRPFDGAPDKDHVAAIMELQAATQEHMLAKHANQPEWVRYTTDRLHAANIRIQEVQ